jgi:MATE family multidrug resistance protein
MPTTPTAPDTVAPTAAPPPLATLPAGTINRQIYILALPMLGELSFNFLVGFVDTYLAGHISKEANVAVGMATYATWLLTVLFTLVGVGAAALVARSIGGGDRRTANRAVNQALLLAVVAGLITSVAAYLLAPALATQLAPTEIARTIARGYLRIDALGYLVLAITAIGNGLLRASGDTRTPMVIMVVVNIVNAIVSVALVHGWVTEPLGPTGIALGTLVARSLGGLIIVGVMLRGPHGFRVRPVFLRPNPRIMARMLRVGLPAAGDSAVMSLAQLLFLSIVSRTATGEAGTANLAAHTIAMRMEGLSYLPAIAWATAAATAAGQYLGARRPDDATRAIRAAAIQGACISATIGAAFILFAGLIYRVMSNDAAVAAAGVPAFRILGFVQPMLAAGMIFTGSLRGIGDARVTMLISLVSGVGLRVPVGYLGGIVLGGGLIGAWCGMWADNITKFVLGYLRFRHGGWRHIRV